MAAVSGCGGGSSGGGSGSDQATAQAFAGASGAIFTTNSTCEQVNGNIYDAKTDVYLDGGPKKEGAAGLPDGTYYYEITDPGCTTLLAGPNPPSGVPDTSGKVITVVNGEFTECLQLAPFDTAPNPGGEYKVHVTPTGEFDESLASGCFGFVASETKTDNFKVRESIVPPPDCPPSTISGLAFEDLNGDCQFDDATETGLCPVHVLLDNGTSIFRIEVSGGTDCGRFEFTDLLPGAYKVSIDPEDVCEPCPPVEVTLGCGDSQSVFVGATTDTTAPEIVCPGFICVQSDCDIMVCFEATATDNCPGDVTIEYDHEPCSLFPLGRTTVHVRAIDRAGNKSTCEFDVFVGDCIQ